MAIAQAGPTNPMAQQTTPRLTGNSQPNMPELNSSTYTLQFD
jgi:hypothetical protein